MSELIVIGVRHHSPACAHLVRREIERLRPAFVLIEGPADFNPHIADLQLPHRLPVAIFSFHTTEQDSRAAYAPFCEASPEFQALRTAWACGAEPLFCDLPTWHKAFAERANHYADPHRLMARFRAANSALASALGAEGQDALWDALAEQADPAELPKILRQYFDLLRPEDAQDPLEAERETFMAQHAAWALGQAGARPVVLVCGGWHVGGIRAALTKADGARPVLPEPEPGARTGSYLVPYGYARLDRFTGYAAGMPSPGYYDTLFTHGLDRAADWAMAHVAAALREAGQAISTADRVAWQGQALALARLRGHRAVLRADLLDAALSALVKEALDVPPAWTEPGEIQRGNDALVVAMLRALSGTAEGQLASGTRQPPLVADIEARLRAADLMPGAGLRRVEVDLAEEATREQAHLLHQLCLLGLPGVTRRSGPPAADATDTIERFEIQAHRHWLAGIIEASIWGGTLPAATEAKLVSTIEGHGDDVDRLAGALSQALFAGLMGLGRSIVAQLRAGLAECSDIAALGRAGRLVYRVVRFGDVFDASDREACRAIAEAIFSRVLWLLEGIRSDAEGTAAVPAVVACRDFALHGTGLQIDLVAARDLFTRAATDDSTPPGLAGAALGYLVASGEAECGAEWIAQRIRRFGLPERLGDFLGGLFALAREEIAETESVLTAVDQLAAGWASADFLRALPALRLAFSWFPPRERELLARRILRRHNFGEIDAQAEAMSWMRQKTTVDGQAAAMAQEARIASWLERYGLA